jgi:prefoldin subunit 5
MSKLSTVADRIKRTKEKLDAEADKLSARLDEIDKTAPEKIAGAHAFLDSQKAEVDSIEATLRQLSNDPL